MPCRPLQATTEVLTMFEDLLSSLDEAERGKLQRSMGMKMEQLKVTTPVRLTSFMQPAGLLCSLTGWLLVTQRRACCAGRNVTAGHAARLT
jgi:hypothetical protein